MKPDSPADEKENLFQGLGQEVTQEKMGPKAVSSQAHMELLMTLRMRATGDY